MKVYSDAALTALAGQTSGTVSATENEQSFTVAGLERGVWYWVIAETATAPNVSRAFTTKFLSPLAKPEELVDLMDDVDNREATRSNATSGGTAGSTAFDNKASNFGGYNKPVTLFYQFRTPRVVNGLGVWSMSSGDTDRHPATIVVYGGSSTNASDFVKLRSISASGWGYGEWRRWAIPNEKAYKTYKITLAAQNQHCYVNELELYGIGASLAPVPRSAGE